MAVLAHTLFIAMPTPSPQQFDPAAAFLGFIFPGAGHVFRKKTSRGVLAAVGVMGLFFFGLLIGGIDAIDSKEDRIWFFGQALVGPATFVVDYAHQNNFKGYDPATKTVRTGYPNEHRVYQYDRWEWVELTQAEMDQGMGPPNTKGLGRLNEIAMLSVVLAGMLNLIIILDALMPRVVEEKPKKKESVQ
jgi:hypothetical protein